jgi:hypothetical protein
VLLDLNDSQQPELANIEAKPLLREWMADLANGSQYIVDRSGMNAGPSPAIQEYDVALSIGVSSRLFFGSDNFEVEIRRGVGYEAGTINV